ncbi:MAG: right-handed parallel beta-helix repeat-containing protein, partial [Candidatus Latescibacteria bacterium]|nr:right-handed parallel beta-helix repeat-containing protein [Candidatus Latescibacterota bacterium]
MRFVWRFWVGLCFLMAGNVSAESGGEVYAGLIGPVGAPEGAETVTMLRIDKPGVYENLIVDGEWGDFDLVKIRADGVILRNCTIRNGLRDAVEVYGRNVRIENCKIHHVLKGQFGDGEDAHGITGRPLNLTIRNTEVGYVSGDAIQFDPSRKIDPYPWDNVLVENCFLWTGPLDADYGGYKKGERPGENAFDSKTHPDQPRARITFRNCLMKGWGHGEIGNGAAMNFKEKVAAVVDNCVFVENDIAFRCRGTRGSAWATLRNVTVYQTTRVFRLEHDVQNMRIFHMAYGEGVVKRITEASGGAGEGYMYEGEREAPTLAEWPYTRLPVGEIIPPGNSPASSDN